MKKITNKIFAFFMVLSMVGSAFAADDIMTPVNDKERGTSMPDYNNTWNLTKSYTGSFNFDSAIYTNYCFTGDNSINVYVSSSSNEPDYFITDFTASLHQRNLFGSSLVGSFTCDRDGSKSKSFSVSASNRYYVYLSKAADGVWLNGKVIVS